MAQFVPFGRQSCPEASSRCVSSGAHGYVSPDRTGGSESIPSEEPGGLRIRTGASVISRMTLFGIPGGGAEGMDIMTLLGRRTKHPPERTVPQGAAVLSFFRKFVPDRGSDSSRPPPALALRTACCRQQDKEEMRVMGPVHIRPSGTRPPDLTDSPKAGQRPGRSPRSRPGSDG